MARVVLKSKMGKKAKKELDAKKRAVWGINPVTRSAPNPKAYNRKKLRIEDRDFDRGFCFLSKSTPFRPLVFLA